MFGKLKFTSKYFRDSELQCQGTGAIKLAPGFLRKLHDLREEVGIPFDVNSCCRSPEHNKAAGGHKKSLHLTENSFYKTDGTCAIDISRRNLSELEEFIIIGTALNKGWCVGINDKKQFIHLDRRIDFKVKNYTQPILWRYK